MTYFEGVRGETVGSLSVLAAQGDLAAVEAIVATDGGRERWRAVDNQGWSALHHAAAAGQAGVVRVLGAAGEGAMVDARTWEGETPLLLACKRLPAARDAVHALLKLKANPNLSTNESCSALQWACVRGEVEVVKWLVRVGARVGHSSVWGETALHLCLKKAAGDEAREAARVAILRYLLRRGARAVCADENQLTPLMLAAGGGLLTCVELLLAEAGSYSRGAAMANLRAEDGATALHMAAQHGRLACAVALLGCGADATLAANDGTLPLHLACIAASQAEELVTLLLPATPSDILEAATRAEPPEQLPSRPEPRRPLSPFQLAVQWENFSCLEVLAGALVPTSFLSPLDACLLHRHRCSADARDAVALEQGVGLTPCAEFPPTLLCPLGLLLSDRLTPEAVAALPHLTSCLAHAPSVVPPLLALLTSTTADPRQDSFHPSLPPGQALLWLAERGAVVEDATLLAPLLLHATVSGLARAVMLGLLAPTSLTAPALLAAVREVVAGQARLEDHVLGRPLLGHRLLATALLATHCSVLTSDWVQHVALMVLDEFRVVLNVSEVVAVEAMYRALRTPSSLQVLARGAVAGRLQGAPRAAVARLPVPKVIRDFLLHSDLRVERMVEEYSATIDAAGEAGVANVIVV